MLWKAHRSTRIKSLLALVLAGTLGVSCVAQAQTSSASAPPITKLRNSSGLKTAVVAATDTGGDAEVAMRALKATNIAMARSVGYSVIPASTVAANLRKAGLRYPFAPRDYEIVRRNLDKAPRIVAVTVTPADLSETNTTYKALVEMFDTTHGGLVGRGEATYTATAESPALVSSVTTMQTPAPAGSDQVLGSFAVPAGTAGAPATADTTVTTTTTTTAVTSGDAPRYLAVDGAILRAVAQMNEPAQLNGIIVSLPAAHMARLSLGEMHGLRNGSRVEYLGRGVPIAYGTVIDVGKGESLATVAGERAFPFLEVNGTWRTVDIPPYGAAGLTRDQIDDKEWKRFERDFGIGAAIAGLAYLVFIAD